MLKSTPSYVHSSGQNIEMWRTDRQTYGQTDRYPLTITAVTVKIGLRLSFRLSKLSWLHFLIDFHQNCHRWSSLEVNIAPPFSNYFPQNPILGQELVKIHASINNLISPSNVRESSKFLRFWANRAEEHDGDIRFKTGSGNVAISCMHNVKYAI